jgi:hypothetical protein
MPYAVWQGISLRERTRSGDPEALPLSQSCCRVARVGGPPRTAGVPWRAGVSQPEPERLPGARVSPPERERLTRRASAGASNARSGVLPVGRFPLPRRRAGRGMRWGWVGKPRKRGQTVTRRAGARPAEPVATRRVCARGEYPLKCRQLVLGSYLRRQCHR